MLTTGINKDQQSLFYLNQELLNGTNLKDYKLAADAELNLVILMQSSSAPTPKPATKKGRCGFLGCSEKVSKIVGQCKYVKFLIVGIVPWDTVVNIDFQKYMLVIWTRYLL